MGFPGRCSRMDVRMDREGERDGERESYEGEDEDAGQGGRIVGSMYEYMACIRVSWCTA